MLTHPTVERLEQLKLTGMARAFAEQRESDLYAEMSFEERFGLLVDREVIERDNRRLRARLANAKLRQDASLEDLDFSLPRKLDRAVIGQMMTCQWIRKAANVFITGFTGVGKTYLACALAQKACREGYDSLYVRMPLLIQDLAVARGDGRYRKQLAALAKKRVLILDDWGLAPLNDESRRDLLELVDDRHGRTSTIVVSQIPVDKWHETIGDPTLADAILDRLVHNAYRIDLKGDTLRPKFARKASAKEDDETRQSR